MSKPTGVGKLSPCGEMGMARCVPLGGREGAVVGNGLAPGFGGS